MVNIDNDKSKSFWGTALFITAVVLILFSLGVWQVQRLGWKNSLIDSLANQESIADAPNLSAWDVSLSKPEPVLFFGHYIPEYTVLVRKDDKVIVYMPFRTSDGVYVMARRGVSDTADVAGKSLAQITNPGTISIIGIPTPRPSDIPMIAEASLAPVWDYLDWSIIQKRFANQPFAPYIFTVLEEPDLGLELSRDIPPIRNEHRNYAIFWFVMAIVAGLLLSRFLLFPKRGE